MSEPLRITCPCGYENWVPEEKRGQTIPCFICGHDLLIEEPAAESDLSSMSTESTTSTQSTALPTTQPAAGPRPPKSGAPRSPFEDDELETAVRPTFQHAPPTPAAPPPSAPRPRSPFEVDAAEADSETRRRGKLVAGPFSLEMAPAAKEGPSTLDQMEAVRPKESRSRHVFIDTISPHDVPTGEKCAQCGRELRGAWDRIETHVGVICYVCSNQGTHDVPQRLKADVSARREIRESELITAPAGPQAPVEDFPWFLDTKSEGFKKAVFSLACGVLLLTFIIALTGWGTPDPDDLAAARAVAAETVAVPKWVQYPLWAWRIVASFLGAFAAIYLTLDRDGHLPHESFTRNAIQILAVIALCTGLAVAAYITLNLLAGIFVAGIIWSILACMIILFIQIAILINLLDFRIRDFLWLFFVYIPITQFLVFIIGLFLQWGLYELVT